MPQVGCNIKVIVKCDRVKTHAHNTGNNKPSNDVIANHVVCSIEQQKHHGEETAG